MAKFVSPVRTGLSVVDTVIFGNIEFKWRAYVDVDVDVDVPVRTQTERETERPNQSRNCQSCRSRSHLRCNHQHSAHVWRSWQRRYLLRIHPEMAHQSANSVRADPVRPSAS